MSSNLYAKDRFANGERKFESSGDCYKNINLNQNNQLKTYQSGKKNRYDDDLFELHNDISKVYCDCSFQSEILDVVYPKYSTKDASDFSMKKDSPQIFESFQSQEIKEYQLQIRNCNKSTLSLNIAAYKHQNEFEKPSSLVSNPEVMEYKSSQKILNLNESRVKESSGAGAGSTNNSSVERANLLKQVFAAPSKITTHNLQPSYPDIAPSFVEIKKKGLCVHGYVQIVEDAADENHNGTFSLLETNIANLINEALVTGNLLTCPISSHSFHQILTTLQIIDLRYLNFHLTDNLLLRDLEVIIAMNSNLKSIDLTAPAVENGEYQEMLFLMAGVPKVTLNITSLKLRDLALTPHCGRHFSTLKISELSEKPSGADCVALLNNYVSINGTLELRFDSEKDADAVSDEVDDVERPFQLQKRLILLFDLDSDDERCGDENDITHDL